ncbi:unnamed protein product [Pedinophyceae sp. YPF-701]|nr:unnamed protein product [Pedinophyceae sp. YPF-701]
MVSPSSSFVRGCEPPVACRGARRAGSDASSRERVLARASARPAAQPVQPGGAYPAKDFCSRCGLCDTSYIAHVKDACAFLGEGMSRIEQLEEVVHGRSRRADDDNEAVLGVAEHNGFLSGRMMKPVDGAQWTGVVSSVAIEMLETGMVDAVVCVASDPEDRFRPRPIVATTKEEILSARGVKPSLASSLECLATLEAIPDPRSKSVLFIGVGCQVQALRSVQKHLPFRDVFVLGTNCVDNGTHEGFEQFRRAATSDPDKLLHYEFMQDYRVHIKYEDGAYEKIPFFCLPANDLNDVIAASCYSCFDYPNYLADLTVGYMGVPYQGGPMSEHPQSITVRNARGRKMLSLIEGRMADLQPCMTAGSRDAVVTSTLEADDDAKFGKGPDKPMPRWLGNVVASILTAVGPKGLEFAKYSVEYHYLRNYLYVRRFWGDARAAEHVPGYARRVVERYGGEAGLVGKRLGMGLPPNGKPPGPQRKRKQQ